MKNRLVIHLCMHQHVNDFFSCYQTCNMPAILVSMLRQWKTLFRYSQTLISSLRSCKKEGDEELADYVNKNCQMLEGLHELQPKNTATGIRECQIYHYQWEAYGIIAGNITGILSLHEQGLQHLTRCMHASWKGSPTNTCVSGLISFLRKNSKTPGVSFHFQPDAAKEFCCCYY